MELQLISKQAAILAKELGFDEICHNIILLGNNEPIRKISIVGTFNTDKAFNNIVCLPEQELLAKWLRDVHNIWIYCHPRGYTDMMKEFERPKTIIKWFNNLSIRDNIRFDTYELAMEDGLIRGLNHLKSLSQTNSK